MSCIKYLMPLLLVVSVNSFAQKSEDIVLKTTGGNIYGTLQTPAPAKKKPAVVLIIAGSGPTDRNGNNEKMVNNSLKMIGDSLQFHGIASLRYDKRGIAASKAPAFVESNIIFDDYVNDVVAWIELLKKDPRFSKIIILGHSEGSLIGMLAAGKIPVAGYVSVAGVAESVDKIIIKQLTDSKQMPAEMIDSCERVFSTLKAGKHVDNVDPKLNILFRPSVQSYFISWIKYEPRIEITKVKIPTMIVQGTTDIQTDTFQAYMLADACPGSKLVIIAGMNHVLKTAPIDRTANALTYISPDLPLKPEFSTALVSFVKALK